VVVSHPHVLEKLEFVSNREHDFCVGKNYTYAKDEAVSKRHHGAKSECANDTTVNDDHDDLKHRNHGSDLRKKAKSESEISLMDNSRMSSENYLLVISHWARKLLLGERSFDRGEDSEQTSQTDPADYSLKSEYNYTVDSQHDSSPEVQTKSPSQQGCNDVSSSEVRDKTPSQKAPRSMSAPGFNNSLRLFPDYPRSMSAPSINQPLRSCLKQGDSSPRSSVSSQSSVHFGTIHIREYRRRLSDNPAVTKGPPIGLGWEYNPQETMIKVDDYENLHPQRRVKEEFLMPARVREKMLISEWGHTLRDVRQASAESKEIRLQREKAVRTSKVSEKLSEALESSKRKFRRFKTGTTKEMEQEKLWQDASQWLDANSSDDDDDMSTYSSYS
jgi:hypothetical protein